MRSPLLLAAVAAIALSACNKEAGIEVDEGGFGTPTMNNTLLMTGQISATQMLGQRFASEVNPMINFAFDSSALTPEAKAILRQQASWIKQFPEVRFRVYGHTDLVGTAAYNKALGLRRANAVVAYFSTLGVSRGRLEAVVSFGKTRPLIQVPGPELRNRRTVTEVVGFVDDRERLLNGKYAEVIFREYVASGVRAHPTNTTVVTQVDGEGN